MINSTTNPIEGELPDCRTCDFHRVDDDRGPQRCALLHCYKGSNYEELPKAIFWTEVKHEKSCAKLGMMGEHRRCDCGAIP